MALSKEELSSTLKHLKRAPAPKAPGMSSGGPEQPGVINLRDVKLKITGKRESLIEDSMASSQYEKENTPGELNSLLKKRKAKFEHVDEDPPHKPPVRPKPGSRKFSDGSEEKGDRTKFRSESFDESEEIRDKDSNGNIVTGTGIPTMKYLPSLQSIGKVPPPKPTKPLILVMKLQKQYKHHKAIIAPKVQPVAIAVENGRHEEQNIEEEGEDIYDDICNAEESPPEPRRPQPSIPTEPEPIEDDMYDDVEQLAETVKAELKASQKTPSNAEPFTEDFYDDCNPSQQQPPLPGLTSVNNTEEGEYGDDIYEGVEGAMDVDGIEEDIENEQEEQGKVQPPPPRQSNKEEDIKKKEKERKEREKKERELQKKKEKEEQRRKKEEEKQERERKKKEEEERRRREKFDRELKKIHKLKGNEEVVSKGTTKEDFSGSGKELPCIKGTFLEVILKDNCPSGKWLVRDPQGHLGYVPSTILEIAVEESETLDEDLYECVDTYKSSEAPPSSIPPSDPVDEQEDFYDDTLVDEDVYDDIPGADM